MASNPKTRRQATLRRYQQQYAALKAEFRDLGYVLQGSLVERWMTCGQPACRCHANPQARHGPYYQWSLKRRGRTCSVYLDPQGDQVDLCKQWIGNHRRLEDILRRMRTLSLRVARLHKITLP